MRLLYRFFIYSMQAHGANLPNLLAGALGMLVNNIFFLMGMWGMLFAGKTDHDGMLLYYIALNAMMMTSWGGINFFFGGWIELGELIVSGHFESKVATPRHPLVLVAMHTLHPAALGDLLMGLAGIVCVFFYGSVAMGLRTMLASGMSCVALFALYVFSGSLAFYVPRGNAVALLIREMVLSLSFYPVGKMFPTGLGRILLLLTPAGAVSILPLDWIESGGFDLFVYACGAIGLMLLGAGIVYREGVKRFQTVSLIGIQS